MCLPFLSYVRIYHFYNIDWLIFEGEKIEFDIALSEILLTAFVNCIDQLKQNAGVKTVRNVCSVLAVSILSINFEQVILKSF